MARVLVLGPEEERAIQWLVNHAAQKENWYRPGIDQWVPGDRPEYNLTLNTYRCVFTWTQSEKKVYRHLSISIPSTRYPNPIAAFMLALEFGFTGWEQQMGATPPPDWQCHVSETEHCVVLAQEIPPCEIP